MLTRIIQVIRTEYDETQHYGRFDCHPIVQFEEVMADVLDADVISNCNRRDEES